MVGPQSWPRSVGAHLLPGVLAFAVYVAAARLLAPRGAPPPFALFLTFLVVLVPYELAALALASRRRAGEGAAEDLIPYRERRPFPEYALLVPPLLAWAFFCCTSAATCYPASRAPAVGRHS